MGDTRSVESASAPRYRVPDDVAWIDGTEIGLGEELYLTRIPSGDTVQLTGTARMIWHAAVSQHDFRESLLGQVSENPADAEAQVEAFVQQLLSARLLT